MHVDDSACNLRVAEPDEVPPRRRHASTSRAFQHVCRRLLLAQEIVVGPSSYPTRGDRRQRARLPPARPRLREPRRLPDVERRCPTTPTTGRATAAAITALMTGRAYARVGAGGRGARARTSATTRTASPAQRVMRMHRDAAYAIARRRLRPTAGCSRPRARPGTRPSRSASSTATATRRRRVLAPTGTISLPDGLRHDRRRAGLLAGQVQGAGRRRADDDRQPHRPARARDASATPTSRSSRSSPTSTSTARSSARPAWPTSTCRSSTSRSASARSRTWGTSR